MPGRRPPRAQGSKNMKSRISPWPFDRMAALRPSGVESRLVFRNTGHRDDKNALDRQGSLVPKAVMCHKFSVGSKMRPILAILVLALCPALALAAPPQNVGAKALRKEIKIIGAAKALVKYYDTPAWINSIMPGMESANAEWLAIARELRTASDGAASEDIDLALYFGAFPKDPFRVIPLLIAIHGGTVESTCTIGFDAEIPKGGVASYLSTIRTRLKAAKTDEEKAIASACLPGLEKTQRDAEAQGIR